MGRNSVDVSPRAVGGQALNEVYMASSSRVPAPAPPVIHAERVGAGFSLMATVKPFSLMREVQIPTMVRGLSGIQPS